MNEELFDFLNLRDNSPDGRPGLLVMANGREHEVAITRIGDKFVYGFIAHWLRLCLYEPTSRSPKLNVILDKWPTVKRECYDAGKLVYLDQECFVRTPHHFMANIAEISAMDLIECPYFTIDPRQDETFNEEILLSVIPALKEYHVAGKGFVSNPAAQAPVLQLSEAPKLIVDQPTS